MHGFSARIFLVFGARGQIWDPGSRIGHGLGLAALGSPKGKYFCGRMVLPQGGTGGPKGGMDSRGVATPLGRPVPPKPTLEKWVYRDFPFFPVSPWALARACVGPVVIPIGPCGDPYWACGDPY